MKRLFLVLCAMCAACALVACSGAGGAAGSADAMASVESSAATASSAAAETSAPNSTEEATSTSMDASANASAKIASEATSSSASAGAASASSSAEAASPATYALMGFSEVDGRQGVAAEGNLRWVSGSTTLSRYDADWNLQATNDDPFSTGYELEVNHIGDIDVYQGEVYCGVELFVDGVAKNIQIAVYDGETLELSRTFNFEPESGQDECAGIAVNPDEGTVEMCAWTDSGKYLYRYDLKTGAYLGKVELVPAPKWQQGVAYHDGFYYLTADDGDADKDAPDHLYRVKIPQGAESVEVVEEYALDDVTKQGEIEGLTFTDQGQLLVVYNRGAKIIEGMPSGFYDGYDHEIHEVFTYDIS